MEVLTEYQEEIADCQILSRAEATELKGLADKGDLNARWRLIESVLKLAYKEARKFEGKSRLAFGELVSEANVMAIQAVDTWEPDRGALSTHTCHVVFHGLVHALSKQGHEGIYVPPQARREALRTQTGEGGASAIKARQALFISSIDRPKDDDDEKSPEVGERPVTYDGDTFCLADVTRIISKLDGVHRKIFRLHYGLNRYKKNYGVRAIAQHMSLSVQEVKDSLSLTLETLKNADTSEIGSCSWCGNDFHKKKITHHYCSQECKDQNDYARRRLGGDLYRPTRRNMNCIKCDKPIPLGSRRPLFCSESCQQQAHRERWDARRAEKRATKVYPQVPCARCKIPFVQKPYGRLYCSSECKDKTHNERDRVKKKKFKCRVCGKAKITNRPTHAAYCSKRCYRQYANMQRRKQIVQETRACKRCKTPFEVPQHSRRLFCTLECVKKHHNEIKKASYPQDRVCPTCEQTFTLTDSSQCKRVYCSDKCQQGKKLTCTVCGTEKVACKQTNNYCSPQCAGIARRRTVKFRTCPHCKTPFPITRSRHRAKYCSRQCSVEARYPRHSESQEVA